MKESLFGDYPWKPYASEVEQIVLHEGLTLIADSAFCDFTALEEIGIPTTVSVIGCESFYNCSSLKSIVIPGSVVTIEQEAFAKCVSLESVTFEPGNLDWLQTEVFEGCEALKEIYLPDTITTIENWVFNNCTGLEIVRFPKEYDPALLNFFDGCVNLKKIYIDDELFVSRFIDFNYPHLVMPLYLDYVFFSESSVKKFQCVPTSGDGILCEVVDGVTYYGYACDEKESIINHKLERYSVLEDSHSAACVYCNYATDYVPHNYTSSTSIDKYAQSKRTTYYCECGYTKAVTEPLYDEETSADDTDTALVKRYITVFTVVLCGVMLAETANLILFVIIAQAVIKKNKNNEKTSE